jgi:putative addiction module killer protein
VRLLEYIDPDGQSPFRAWFDELDSQAAARVTTSLIRLEQGNWSNAKGIGGGLIEYRIDFGPGYRIYFGRDGDELVILLAGGTKQRQPRDIAVAKLRWADYKRRKRQRH